ncbi:MAG: sortase [Thermoleophilia bacterium]|nr:sortase [Thermoleophilia bacterium]
MSAPVEPGKTRRREYLVLAALVLLGLAVALGTVGVVVIADGVGAPETVPMTWQQTSSSEVSTTASVTSTDVAPVSSGSSSTTAPSTTTTIYTHPIAEPARIVIPAIRVDAEIIPVGLLENGAMEVPPFGLAGWYKLGPAPGASGPAVIVAHVDSKKGPDVFYHLKDLDPGDEIMVYGEDGDVAVFVMDSKEEELKTELPIERIWNNTKEPVIRLITCTGEFNRKTGHYLSNLIVYGHLVR